MERMGRGSSETLSNLPLSNRKEYNYRTNGLGKMDIMQDRNNTVWRN